MKPIHLLAVTSLLASTSLIGLLASVQFSPVLAQDTSVYLDDRSSPAQLIHSLYNAINRREYGRAYGYFSTPPAASYEAYEAGFADTEQVEVLTGVAFADPGAGTTHYTLPVAIRSTNAKGENKVFAGCYTLTLSSPSAQTTPFTPLNINEGKLQPAEGELKDVLPTRCSDDEEPRTEEALLLEQASVMFETAFGSACNAALAPEETPQHHRLTFRYSYASEGAPDEVAHLFRFFCDRGAYNAIHVYLMMDEAGVMKPLSFATPELHIEYEDDDSDKAATDLRIVGFQTDSMLINSDYDPETFTISSHAKWRGIGDAFSAGKWLFRQGKFSLVRYDVDPSTDGEIEPITVLDYDAAP